MRYQIAYYIYEHGSLPVGDDPAVRNIVWGISYAFSPILDYMIAAVFMKLVSFITTVPFALLMAARFVNILLGLGTVWLALDMGKRLFDRRKAGRFQPVFPCGCLFSADGRRSMRKCSFSPVPHLHKGSSAVFVKVQNF